MRQEWGKPTHITSKTRSVLTFLIRQYKAHNICQNLGHLALPVSQQNYGQIPPRLVGSPILQWGYTNTSTLPQKENGDTVPKIRGKSNTLMDFNTLIVCWCVTHEFSMPALALGDPAISCGISHHMSHMPPFLITTIIDHPPLPNATPHPEIRAKMLRYQVSYPLPFMQAHLIP